MFQVEDVESKMDLLIDMYKEDRKILLQNAQAIISNQSSQTEITPCLKNSLATPRSILHDRTSSEPSTPTIRNAEKAMHRNLSDLGQRIKKRVTYRLLSLNESDSSTHDRGHSTKSMSRHLSTDSEGDTDDGNSMFDMKDEENSDPAIVFSVEKEINSNSVSGNQNEHPTKGRRKMSSKRKENYSSHKNKICNNLTIHPNC